MDKLIIVRHGDETNGDLNARGRDEIAKLSKKLLDEHLCVGGSKRILSSTAPRALQSAMILRAVTGVDIEDDETLWPLARGTRADKVPFLVRKVTADFSIIIAVTHLEYTFKVPKQYMSYRLQRELEVGREILRGQAVVIDCKEKTIHQVTG